MYKIGQLTPNLATDNNDKGLVTADTYLGIFTPSGITTDLDGNTVMVPNAYDVKNINTSR